MPIKFITAAQIDDRPVDWLWPDYIPCGGVTMLEGLPESCKTSVLCDLVARQTTGRSLPLCDAAAQIGNALILNSEDPAGSLRARLALAGADLNRVVLPDVGQKLILPADMAELEGRIDDSGLRLIVLDPLVSFSNASLTAGTAARKLMDELNALAQRTGTAIVGVRHWTKAAARDAIYRAAGSHAFTAACRSELVVAIDPLDPRRRIIAQLKNNLAATAPSLVFGPVPHEHGVTIKWIGPSAVSISELLDAVQPRERPALDEAKRVLFSILGDGPVLANEAKALAQRAGVKEKTLTRAKQELRVVSLRQGFGPGSQFFWQLPSKDEPAVAQQWQLEVERVAEQLFDGDDSAPTPISRTPSSQKRSKRHGDEGDEPIAV